LWAQLLCQNSIMAGLDYCVQTVLALRLRFAVNMASVQPFTNGAPDLAEWMHP
jgi:hypothetical protein